MARLLVVEDETDIVETVLALLGAMMPDVQVDVARNGLDAIRLMEQQEYDALLTDYRMPGMDGLALMQWVRKKRPRINALMFTAFMDPEFMGRAHAAVPDLKVIPKPLDVEFFLKHVGEALGRQA